MSPLGQEWGRRLWSPKKLERVKRMPQFQLTPWHLTFAKGGKDCGKNLQTWELQRGLGVGAAGPEGISGGFS